MNPRDKVNAERKLDVKARQEIIIDIISTEEIRSLDELIESLQEVGINRSKPTISRDIQELGIKKNYKGHFVLPESEHISKLRLKLKTLLDNNMLFVTNDIDFYTIKVNPGKAQLAAYYIDEIFGDKIIGTMFGVDYVIVILAIDDEYYDDLVRELNELTETDIIPK